MNPCKNILVITYWSFSDALIETYTLPYLAIIKKNLPIGSKIFLVTLENYNSNLPIETDIPGLYNIRFKYSAFGFAASFNWLKNIFSLTKIIKRNDIKIIHTFCTPAGMMGFLLSKITNKPLILDSFEPHAESMVENGEWKKNSLSYRILHYFERKQTQRASYIIGTTPGMREYAIKNFGVSPLNFFVKPACVNLEMFRPDLRKDADLLKSLNLENMIVCVYAGKFGGIYLKHEIFDFYKACYEKWKDNFVALILTSHSSLEMDEFIEQSGLPKTIFRIAFVSHFLIPKYIGLGDFALTPVKPVSSKKYCTPIKNGEYWAMGLPVVITKDISVDSDLISENNIGYVLNNLSTAEYVNAVNTIDCLINNSAIAAKIRVIAEKERNYTIAENVYRTIYASF